MAIALTLASTAFSIYANNASTKYAAKAAQAESQARQNLYDRQAQDRSNALKENSRIRLQERDRTLSELRVAQAASGFAQSGTQLAVFGDFRSRLDDEIDEATNQGLDQIAAVRNQAAMDRFSTDVQVRNIKYSGKMNNIAIGISGLTNAFGNAKRKSNAGGWGGDGGNDPFSLF